MSTVFRLRTNRIVATFVPSGVSLGGPSGPIRDTALTRI